MGRRRGPAGYSVHLLQQVPAQCAEESARLLRAAPFQQRPRRDAQGADDDLRHPPDAQSAAGAVREQAMTPEVPYPLHKPEPPASYVEAQSRKRRRWGLAAIVIMLLLMLAGLVLAVLGVYFAIR